MAVSRVAAAVADGRASKEESRVAQAGLAHWSPNHTHNVREKSVLRGFAGRNKNLELGTWIVIYVLSVRTKKQKENFAKLLPSIRS